MEHKSKYLQIKPEMDTEQKKRYVLVNTQQKVRIGTIERMSVGRFMHWCLIPEKDTYFSNGCLKEISSFITKLYSKKDVQVE